MNAYYNWDLRGILSLSTQLQIPLVLCDGRGMIIHDTIKLWGNTLIIS